MLNKCLSSTWNFSLLFCYFNNRAAFNEYVKCYKGNFIIIIGPATETHRYTEPLPLDPEFQENKDFKVVLLTEFNEKRDLIAIYERIDKRFCV